MANNINNSNSEMHNIEFAPSLSPVAIDQSKGFGDSEFESSIVQNISVGLFCASPDTKIVRWNAAIEKITEIPAELALGKSIITILEELHPDANKAEVLPAFSINLNEIVNTGKNRWIEKKRKYSIKTNSGLNKVIETQVSTVPHQGLFGIICTVRDISEEHKNNQKIIGDERKFLNIFANSPIAILIVDLSNHTIYDSNSAFTQLFEWKAEDVVGKNSQEFNFWCDSTAKKEYYEQLLFNKSVDKFTASFNTKNNKRLVCSISGCLIDINGRECVIHYIDNITEKVNEEHRLNTIRVELEEKVNFRNVELEQINLDLQDQMSVREQTEQSLRISEENYRSLVDQIPVGIYRTSLAGKFLQANPALAKIFGFDSVESLMEVNAKELYAFPEQRDSLFNDGKYLGDIFKEEIKVRKHDGSFIWIIDYAQITLDEKHQSIVDGVIQDITEQKIAQSALKDSEEKFRKLFENLTDIFISFNAQGFITNISPSFERMSGIDAKHFLYRSIDSILSDNPINNEFMEGYDKVADTSNFTIVFCQSSKKNAFHSINLRAIRARDGSIIAYEGIARDISSELLHNKITNTLYDISRAINTADSLNDLYAYIHTALGNIIDTTNFFIAILDQKEQMICFPYLVDELDDPVESIPLDTEDSYTAMVIKGKKPILRRFEEIERKAKDDVTGTYSQVWLGVPLQVKDKVIGAIVVQSYKDYYLYDENDINLLKSVSDQIALAIDRKNSQIAMDNQLKFVNNLLDTIPNAIYYKDAQTLKYKLCNKAYASHLGISADSLIGKTVFEVFSSEKAINYNQYDEELIRTKIPQSYQESFIANGVMMHLLVVRTCLLSANGDLEGIVGAILDITEQRKAAESVSEALQKEIELNELKNKFISMVSHEYRTPLQSIMLSTELLRDYNDKLNDESRMNQFDRIKNSISTLNSMLDDILLLNKSERGRLQFAPGKININKMTECFIREMQFIAKDKCELILTLNSPELVAFADEKLLHIVLSNLINNAIKYSKNEKYINISLEVQNEKAVFEISDYGIGIPEAEQEFLFTPFFRSSNVGTISGTGLGLSIVKDAVKLQGGTIWFESTFGKGTTFYVEIPYPLVLN